MSYTQLAYLVGGIGVLVEWRSYHLHHQHDFRRWSAIGAGFWAIQYLLLTAWTAGLTMAVTALRTLLSGGLTSSGSKHVAASGFILIFAGLTWLSWQGAISLLPAFAVINTTLALVYFDNRNMRISLIASSFAWINNDIYWQAWPALFAEVVAVGINIRTIRKL
ncbi:MAG: hypothetical protein CTY19_01785 [Methylomonas sp.]|nr:MAG: hypothetical protein CTY19_01785 [Methylomonas sp.]